MEEQRRLRSRVRTRRPRNRSSDDVRALRRQADRERKRAARQQATAGANLMIQRYRVWSMDRQRIGNGSTQKWRVEVTMPLCPGCPAQAELILVCVGNFNERILSSSS